MKKIVEWLNSHILIKHLILAVSVVIVFIFAVNITLNFFTRHNKYHKVPDFSGMSFEEAGKAARKGSLHLEIYDSLLYVPEYDPGVILIQQPEAGTEVKSGRKIFVAINSPRQRMVRIPYVTGVSLRQATNDLKVAGLTVDKLIYQTDMATNYVLETRYGTKVIRQGSTLEAEQGSGVTLIVGMNPEEQAVTIPKVVGFPLNEARNRLWELGLNLGSVDADSDITPLNRNDARVYRQSPEQGTRVMLGTAVSLRLTTETEKIEQGSSSSDREAKRIISAQKEEETQREREESAQEDTQ